MRQMTPIGDMPWYRPIPQSQRLFQGELLFGCPILTWKPEPFDPARSLEEMIGAEKLDVVVMSQDCDIENGNLGYIVLCPHYPLEGAWKDKFKVEREKQKKKFDASAWQSHINSLRNGSIWSLSLLDRVPSGDLRVVNFKEVYSLPIEFLP